jgi:WD40 repeat protein
LKLEYVHRFIEVWDRVTRMRVICLDASETVTPRLGSSLPSGGLVSTFSPDGRLLAATIRRIDYDSGESRMRERSNLVLYDAATGQAVRQLSPGTFTGAVWNRDSKRVLARSRPSDRLEATSRAGHMSIYEVPSGNKVRSWAVKDPEGTAFAFILDGNTIARADEDGTIHLFDLRSESDKPRARWQAHDTAVSALAVSPDGTLLASGARDGSVRVWNIPRIRAELRKLHPGLDW